MQHLNSDSTVAVVIAVVFEIDLAHRLKHVELMSLLWRGAQMSVVYLVEMAMRHVAVQRRDVE